MLDLLHGASVPRNKAVAPWSFLHFVVNNQTTKLCKFRGGDGDSLLNRSSVLKKGKGHVFKLPHRLAILVLDWLPGK
jgi:hypothetical protein